MWISIILLSGLACSLVSILCFDWINSFYDSWIILVSFLVGMFIGLLLIIITIIDIIVLMK